MTEHEIIKDIYGKLGMAGSFYCTALNCFVEEELLPECLGKIDLEPSDIHRLTCNVLKMDTRTKYGYPYLSEKILHLKLSIKIDAAELLDDEEKVITF